MTERSERIALAVRAARAADDLVLADQDTLGSRDGRSIPKVPTGIPGFDAVTMGGIPQRRATILAGQAWKVDPAVVAVLEDLDRDALVQVVPALLIARPAVAGARV